MTALLDLAVRWSVLVGTAAFGVFAFIIVPLEIPLPKPSKLVPWTVSCWWAERSEGYRNFLIFVSFLILWQAITYLVSPIQGLPGLNDLLNHKIQGGGGFLV